MTDAGKTFREIAVRDGENCRIVAMIQFQDYVMVATARSIYKLNPRTDEIAEFRFVEK